MPEEVEQRLHALELAVAKGPGDMEFHQEVRIYIAESRASRIVDRERHKELQGRVQSTEDRLRELELFKAKLMGAVLAAGTGGGALGGGIAALIQALS